MVGQTVLITGAAKRIGRKIALRFAKEGASVMVHYNKSSEDALELFDEILKLGSKCELYCADLSDKEGRETFLQELKSSKIINERGGLDVLINSASIFEKSSIEDTSEDDWDSMMEINAKAPYFLIKGLLNNLRNVEGNVINLIDTSYQRPWPFYSNYCASKSALRSLTLSLAIELAPFIRVNGIAPGAIMFPNWMDENERKDVLTNVPLGREGTCEEIAETAIFLANGPKYITGQIIAVDGGWSLSD